VISIRTSQPGMFAPEWVSVSIALAPIVCLGGQALVLSAQAGTRQRAVLQAGTEPKDSTVPSRVLTIPWTDLAEITVKPKRIVVSTHNTSHRFGKFATGPFADVKAAAEAFRKAISAEAPQGMRIS